MRNWLFAALIVFGGSICYSAETFSVVPDWLKLLQGRPAIGNMHGDIAVSSTGDVYISVQDPLAGLQVYAPDGTFVKNVPNAPTDLHGFVIRTQPDGEYIFGPTLRSQTIVKMRLDGAIVMTIGTSVIPDAFKSKNPTTGLLGVRLTGMDVAPTGDLYVTDGYGSDYVHRFDRAGTYVSSFGGKAAPYGFNTLHKIAVDTRFQPARIIGCDRENNRLVHLSLEGAFLGVVAEDLLRPAAVAISGEHAVVGELNGRVSILDKAGKVVARLGANTDAGVGTNKIPREQWRSGIFVSPHGVAVNPQGDLFVSEFSVVGRMHRFNRN